MTALTPSEKTELVRIALAAARDAAAFVSQGYRKGVRAEHKGRVDLVTRFDRESEQLLRERLVTETRFSVVGEEAGGATSSLTWYVDPLDGTTNFVHGHPFYCVSVGLLAGLDPVLGAVVAPALACEWTGIADGESTRNGERCRVSEVARFQDALLATGFPYDRSRRPDNNFDAFVAIKQKCQAVRRCGSAALDLCLVGDGTYDGYWERTLRPWDLAAGSAIVLGAGGRFTDFDEGKVDPMTGNVVATNGAIHDALLAALAAVHSA